ncbi:MAG: acyl carrier protein [Spirochaetia bacterium]|nr:acyl carrier protein [Spirochaetia bacterium]
MTKEEIYKKLVEIFVQEFDMDESKISPSSLVVEDLDLDSIDAVDIIVKMKQVLPVKLNAEAFRQVRTVEDIVNILYDYSK